MNILVDPAVPGDALRQQLYTGNLVILTRLQALSDFVDYTREELTELFRPYDAEHVHEHTKKKDSEQRLIHNDRATWQMHVSRPVGRYSCGRGIRGDRPRQESSRSTDGGSGGPCCHCT